VFLQDKLSQLRPNQLLLLMEKPLLQPQRKAKPHSLLEQRQDSKRAQKNAFFN
jgi:hypothetical protein